MRSLLLKVSGAMLFIWIMMGPGAASPAWA